MLAGKSKDKFSLAFRGKVPPRFKKVIVRIRFIDKVLHLGYEEIIKEDASTGNDLNSNCGSKIHRNVKNDLYS